MGIDRRRAQADRTLATEQRRTDFRPPEDGDAPPLDRPTEACSLVAALLSALLRLAAQHLQASNLASFDTEARARSSLPSYHSRVGGPCPPLPGRQHLAAQRRC